MDALKEMQREISDFYGKAATTAEELSRVQSIAVRTLPGSFETASSLLSMIGDINRYAFADNYVEMRTKRIKELVPALVQTAAKTIQPSALTWVIVGDLAKIEAGVRALNLGTVQVIDADGKP